MTKQRLVAILIGLLLVATIIATIKHSHTSPVFSENGTSSFMLHPSYAVNVFKIENDKWVYEILINNKQLIYQEKIPCVPGNVSFQSQADALKCGELVLHKIKRKESPTVTLAEIDSLGIAY
jgi:hypothetical protein